MTLDIKEYKPRVIVDPIRAVQVTLDNIEDVAQLVKGSVYKRNINHDYHVEEAYYVAYFGLDRVVDARIGDYIVEGPQGVFRTELAKRFERKYEEV